MNMEIISLIGDQVVFDGKYKLWWY